MKQSPVSIFLNRWLAAGTGRAVRESWPIRAFFVRAEPNQARSAWESPRIRLLKHRCVHWVWPEDGARGRGIDAWNL